MANLTNIIGGQPYFDYTNSNTKSLLDFWKGTQVQYDYLKQTGGTTASNPSSASQVVFTVSTTAYFSQGKTVYITGTAPGNTTRTTGTIASLTGTTLTIDFATPYTSASSAGYTIDCYDPKTLYLITT
tara:strand:+ start:3066 stop:3449 length:384 start_codon:yes stop_codon:yes gene_type:complete